MTSLANDTTAAGGDTFSGEDCSEEAWKSILDAKLLSLQSAGERLQAVAAAAVVVLALLLV